MKYKNMKEISHGFLKKYKILQKLVYVMITKNISDNLHRVVRSAVTNKFNTARNMALYQFRLRFSDVLLMSFLKKRNIGILGCEASLTSSLTNSSGRGCLEVLPKGKTLHFFIFRFYFQ